MSPSRCRTWFSRPRCKVAAPAGYGDFKEEVKRLLNIPKEAKVVALLPMGFPDEQPRPKPKKPLSEIVHYNCW